ncbi:MAG: MoaD/ThiS family protein [Candidatus Aenigmarchaeota archaeon]|nr:MoaD/ThiS family protein [Candidatus Aenigmarchaeota archaeon]
MEVTIIVSGEEKDMPLVKGDTVSDILKKAKINPETVIVRRKNTIIPDDEEVRDGDSLYVLKVVSGG